MEMVYANYATAEMVTKDVSARLYAELVPNLQGGVAVNLCPDTPDCHEYRKEEARLARAQKAREAREKKQSQHPRFWMPKDLRRKIARKQRFQCAYCGIAQGAYRKGKRIKTCVDHVIPLSKGGSPLEESNLALACYDCNQAKSDQLWEFGCRIGFYDDTLIY